MRRSYKQRLSSLLWEHQPILVTVRILKGLFKNRSLADNQQFYIFNNADEIRLIGYNIFVLWGVSLAFISWNQQTSIQNDLDSVEEAQRNNYQEACQRSKFASESLYVCGLENLQGSEGTKLSDLT